MEPVKSAATRREVVIYEFLFASATQDLRSIRDANLCRQECIQTSGIIMKTLSKRMFTFRICQHECKYAGSYIAVVNLTWLFVFVYQHHKFIKFNAKFHQKDKKIVCKRTSYHNRQETLDSLDLNIVSGFCPRQLQSDWQILKLMLKSFSRSSAPLGSLHSTFVQLVQTTSWLTAMYLWYRLG